MPVEGWKSITVSEDLYKKLDVLSTRTHRSIPQTIEYLLENGKKEV